MSRDNAPQDFQNPSLEVFHAVSLDFESTPVHLAATNFDVTFGGRTYLKTNGLLSISSISEDGDLSAKGASLLLSGADVSLLALAIQAKYQHRKGEIYIVTRQGVTLTPYMLFSGTMDVMEIGELVSDSDEGESGETCRIELKLESDFVKLRSSKVSRFTSEHQKKINHLDTGLDNINSLQGKVFKWEG